jgi:ATP synthase protein I
LRDHTDNIRKKFAAYRILAVATVITAALALLLYISVDGVTAYSVALGGGVFIIPNTLFARYVFRYSATESADLAMRWFFLGEAIKLITTVILFAMCFMLVTPLNVIALIANYAGMMLLNMAGLALIKTN